MGGGDVAGGPGRGVSGEADVGGAEEGEEVVEDGDGDEVVESAGYPSD